MGFNFPARRAGSQEAKTELKTVKKKITTISCQFTMMGIVSR
jgi:hypothetical protein